MYLNLMDASIVSKQVFYEKKSTDARRCPWLKGLRSTYVSRSQIKLASGAHHVDASVYFGGG